MKKIVGFAKKVNTFLNNMADVPVEIAVANRHDVDHVNIHSLKQHRDFPHAK